MLMILKEKKMEWSINMLLCEFCGVVISNNGSEVHYDLCGDEDCQLKEEE